jgi:GR25 family glycosyltransferase involved in LPS biosynthesis
MSPPDRAYIIHLPEDTRRIRNVQRLTQSLRDAGVAHVEVHQGIRPQDRGPMYSVGEWGCYQSHVACLRRIAAEPDAGGALVLEDDAVLSASPDELRALLDADAPWDFLHLGYLSRTVFRDWDEELFAQELLRSAG